MHRGRGLLTRPHGPVGGEAGLQLGRPTRVRCARDEQLLCSSRAGTWRRWWRSVEGAGAAPGAGTPRERGVGAEPVRETPDLASAEGERGRRRADDGGKVNSGDGSRIPYERERDGSGREEGEEEGR